MSESVAILVNGYLDGVGMQAGGNVQIVNLARELDGFDVTFFGPERARAGFLAAVPGSRFVAMPEFASLPPFLDLLLRGICGVVRRPQLRAARAIVATSHLLPDVLPAVAARPRRTLVIVHHLIEPPWERDGNAARNWIAWLGQELSLFFVRAFVARLAFVSSYVKSRAAGLIGNRRAYVTPNAAAAPPGFVPEPFERRRGAIVLGRVHRAKRVGDAIAAWARLPPPLRSEPLRIVGPDDGGYRRELESLCADLGIAGSVVFYGRVDEAEKWRLLGESAIFVFPSGEEGWGLAVAEAMAAGLPCVTYDLPVYRDIFVRGRLAVPLGDAGALASACGALLSDAPLRARLASEALDLATTFSWRAAAAGLARALDFEQ